MEKANAYVLKYLKLIKQAETDDDIEDGFEDGVVEKDEIR
jgi:hypothetical protein